MVLFLAIESQPKVWNLQFFPNSPEDAATSESREKGKGSSVKVVV